MNTSATTRARLSDPHGAAMGPRRTAVLACLREAETALTAGQVASSTGLHVNTARFHLDHLVAAGAVERSTEPRLSPGRPRILYLARATASGQRSFALLAEMMTGIVAALDGAGPAATEAGRAWGRHLIDRPAPSDRLDAAEASRRLNELLADIGFQPQAGEVSDEFDVELHHCPFREVAERHTDVVCAIHLGLMQGAISEMRAPLEATSLTPWVRRNLCVARLRATSTARPESTSQ